MLDNGHFRIIMFRIVMEQCQLLGIGGPAQANAFLPCRMPPPDFLREFFVGVGAIVNHQIGIFDEIKNDRVRGFRIMFGIGHITHRITIILDTKCRRPVGMTQGCRLDHDTVSGMQFIPDTEILKCQL